MSLAPKMMSFKLSGYIYAAETLTTCNLTEITVSKEFP